MAQKKYKFKFSVVSAVYNVEPYLDEMIESIVNQDIGFKKNVQLILVDDCSTDNSFEICKKWQKKFPNNIIVLKTKQNSRQAYARNTGLKLAQGKYITFTDPDDILSLNTFSSIYKFFEINYKLTDVVSIPLIFFGDLHGEHHLNGKYHKGSRVIDLNKEPDAIQLSVATAFIKNEVCKDLINFDSRLFHAEDAKEVLKILARKQTLGVVSNAIYYYRKRATGTISQSNFNKDSYISYMENFQEFTIDYYKKKFNKIPEFIQQALMYDLQGNLKQRTIPDGILTDYEKDIYFNKILNVISHINNNIIWQQKYIQREIKWALSSYNMKNSMSPQKYNKIIDEKLNSGKLMFRVIVDYVEITSNRLKLHFHTNYFSELENHQFFVKLNKKNIPVELKNDTSETLFKKLVLYKSKFYYCEIDYTKLKLNKLSFSLKFNDIVQKINDVVFTKNCPLNASLKKSYFIKNGYKLKLLNGDIIMKKTKIFDRIGSEIKFEIEILKTKTNLKKFKIFLARWLYLLLYPFMHKKNIWIFSDKADKADDNGEAFFKYAVKNKSNQKMYFLINKKYPDYKRMKKYGKVVNYGSIKHFILYMFCSYNISAYSHLDFRNPFMIYEGFFRDISANHKYVFLQHGIIFGDLSKLLKKSIINTNYFVTSTVKEYESVLDERYGYDKRDVILTGLPRFDYTYNDDKKIITIAPTWRKDLFSGLDPKTSQRLLNSNFENSKYYKKYTNLLNSDKLHDCAKKFGYTIQFLPHSIFLPYVDRFKLREEVKTVSYDNISYRKIFAESSLMLTDYSSLVFDFAYLKKPVVYYQFDKFEGGYNYNEGYFSFEDDGFGEVVYEEDEMIDLLCEYMKNNCKMKNKYVKRVENTFKFNDTNNCKRIFDILVNDQNKN